MRIVFPFSLLFICLVIGSNGGLLEQLNSQKARLKPVNPDDLKKPEESLTNVLLQRMEKIKSILDQKAVDAAYQEENNDSDWGDSEENVAPPTVMEDMPPKVIVDEQRVRDETQYAKEIEAVIRASYHAINPISVEDPIEKAQARDQTNQAVAGKFAGTQPDD